MSCIKNHKRGAEILLDYCAGTLAPDASASFESHLRECAECRNLVEAQRAVWETLDAWTPSEVSADFDSRLYARVAAENAGPAWRRWWSRLSRPATPYSWWKPMVSLAVAGAIVSMALIVRPLAPTAPVPAHTSVVQTVQQPEPAGSDEIDLQQVQQALDDLDIVAPMGPASGQAAPSPL